MKHLNLSARTLAFAVSLAVLCGVVAAVATARASAVPANTAAPTITGTAKEGSTLTASTGTWTNNPTSYTYKWQRCASDGTGCGDIANATDKTYTLTSGDVGHTVRVVVTAANADGKASAPSAPTEVVDSKNGPSNTVRPVVSGRAQVGYALTVSTGTWTPSPTSYSYQWQRCNSSGAGCLNVAGATARTYGLRTVDVGHRMRALVTAHVGSERSTVASSASAVVAANTTTTVVTTTRTTTTTSTTTVRGNQPPSLGFLSLSHRGKRVYARFRVCDDGLGTITIVERDVKSKVISATRRFRVVRLSSCGVFTRSWIPAKRFRTKGRYVVTLRAIDTSHALSRLKSRSFVWH